MQCKLAKKRRIDKKTRSCAAIELKIKFTLSNFYFATYKNTQELIGNTPGALGGYFEIASNFGVDSPSGQCKQK